MSQKRKRAEIEDGGAVSFAVSGGNASAVGPILASFPALHPPNDTPFSVYSKKTPVSDQEFASRPIHVAGETDAVEFHSTDESSGGCRYLIGVHNKKTNVVKIRPAPVQIMARRVKALKNLTPAPSTSSTERIAQRITLGETFGTRKAQKAIRAAERNKIDVSAMHGMTEHIQDSIESNTKSLPTKEEAIEIADTNRLIPPHDASASSSEEVYKLSEIIPDVEFNALPISRIKSATSFEDRMSLMPFKRSEWVRQSLRSIFEDKKPNEKRLRIVLYVSCLMAFRISAHKLSNNREAIQQRLQGMPDVVVDGILNRFTEKLRGTDETRFTSDKQVRLMTYMFALCLHADRFATDTSRIAADLQESVPKINQHFKLLGCRIVKPSATEIAHLGIPASSADVKRAILRIPLEFPKPRKRKN